MAKKMTRTGGASAPPVQNLLHIDEKGAPAGALSPEHLLLVEELIAWFNREQRKLPWRETYAPYHVWISEIMLQQTQMGRGAQFFTRWIERFPTVQSVAEADPDELLKAWEGLGYYSRVRNIQKAAQAMMDRHGGQVPDDKNALLALPGIGEYTAGAIASIAYKRPYAAVDANVERVFSRIFDVAAPVKSPPAAGFIRHMADSLLPADRPREFNQALMEFGALVCSKRPKCELCPIQRHCQAYHLGITEERPIPGKKAPYTALEIVSGVLVHAGRVFVQKRLDSGVWAGFWEFPGGRLETGETPEQGIVREFFEETEFAVLVTKELGLVRHAYTRYKIGMHCFMCAIDTRTGKMTGSGSGKRMDATTVYGRDQEGMPVPQLHAATAYAWLLPEELQTITLPAGHRKLVDAWMEYIQDAALATAPDYRGK